MMGCETWLNGAAGQFHCGRYFGIRVDKVSKMSYTQKVATNRSDGMPILVSGPTNLIEAYGCHRVVNVAIWLAADEDDVRHSGDSPESSRDYPAK